MTPGTSLYLPLEKSCLFSFPVWPDACSRASSEGHFTHGCPKKKSHSHSCLSSESNTPFRWQKAAYGGLDGDRCSREACVARAAKWTGKRRNKCLDAGCIRFTNLTDCLRLRNQKRNCICSYVWNNFLGQHENIIFHHNERKRKDMKDLTVSNTPCF